MLRNHLKRKHAANEFDYLPENKRLLTEKIAADMGVLRLVDDPSFHNSPFISIAPDTGCQMNLNYHNNIYTQQYPNNNLHAQMNSNASVQLNINTNNNNIYMPQNNMYSTPQPSPYFFHTPQLNTTSFPPPTPPFSYPPYQPPVFPQVTTPSYWQTPTISQQTPPAQETEENKSRALIIVDNATQKEPTTKFTLNLPEKTQLLPIEPLIPLHCENMSRALILYTPPKEIIEDSLKKKKKEEKEKEKEKEKLYREAMICEPTTMEAIEIEPPDIPIDDISMMDDG